MEFKISLPKEVLEIFSVIEEYGAEAYIVGGCVRDSVLGRKPHDWDICTSVLAVELLSIFEEKGYKVIPTGLQHGTITVVIDGERYEITQFRRDGNYSDMRHPDSVEFTSNLIEDLKRRDFTINAMAYNPKIGLVDPFGGIRDIRNQRIVCVGSAKDRFSEDALRILRAIRFSAQLNFIISEKTDIEILKQYTNLNNVSTERILSEFCKIALSNNFHVQMFFYEKVFGLFIPEIKDMVRFPQNNPYHIYDVWEHTIKAVKWCSKFKSTDLITRLAVFFHDFGKPHSYQDGGDGIRHFKGHGRVSADMTDIIMRRLRFDNDTREKVVELVYYHDASFAKGKKYVKRWLNKIGEIQFRRLLEVRRADIMGQSNEYEQDRLEDLLFIESLIKEVIEDRDCFTVKDLSVNGKDLISIGYCQGCKIGEVLKKLLELVINEEVKNKKDELLKLAKKWLNNE